MRYKKEGGLRLAVDGEEPNSGEFGYGVGLGWCCSLVCQNEGWEVCAVDGEEPNSGEFGYGVGA